MKTPLAWSRSSKIFVFTLFLQPLNNTVSLLRGEMASDVGGEHVHRSCFSVGLSTKNLEQLNGAVAETS